jgi:hypothetical protein
MAPVWLRGVRCCVSGQGGWLWSEWKLKGAATQVRRRWWLVLVGLLLVGGCGRSTEETVGTSVSTSTTPVSVTTATTGAEPATTVPPDTAPVISVVDPTGRTGGMTLVVEVTDAQGADSIESLTVVQEFNFQVPDHAEGVIEGTNLEPISVDELSSGLTAVSFGDARFDFVYGVDKEIAEYISTNPLGPIEVTQTGPGVFEVSFSTEWPGRFPLHLTATDTDGHTTSIRVPVEVYWTERPWEIVGTAIEFQFLHGAGEIDVAEDLIDRAVAQNQSWIQLVPTGVAPELTSTELAACQDVPATAAECISPSIQQLASMVAYAQSKGLDVMIKPHVFASGFFGHEIAPVDWGAWFDGYGDYILPLAELAEEHGVGLFSLGNELQSTHGQDDLWARLLNDVRGTYSGPITYSDFTFWTGGEGLHFPIEEQLDYLGVPFYYPGVGTNQDFVENDEPTVDQIEENLRDQLVDLLLSRSAQAGLPAIATELGRFNHEGAVYDPWGQRGWPLPLDNQEQIDYFEAALRNGSEYLDGVFFWSYKTIPYEVINTAPHNEGVPGYSIDIRVTPIEQLIAIWSR